MGQAIEAVAPGAGQYKVALPRSEWDDRFRRPKVSREKQAENDGCEASSRPHHSMLYAPSHHRLCIPTIIAG
jgi:hypothetical protein